MSNRNHERPAANLNRFRPQLESLEEHYAPSSIHSAHYDGSSGGSVTQQESTSATTISINLFGPGHGHHRNGAVW
jgi:hypothetical protein